jgi:hypothetical protein
MVTGVDSEAFLKNTFQNLPDIVSSANEWVSIIIISKPLGVV